MTVTFFTPHPSQSTPETPIFAAFRQLVAALCVAAAAEEEAEGDSWDPATTDWPDDAAAAWKRVSDLACALAQQPSQSIEDRALIGAAQIVHSAVHCDTADGLFALRERMRIGLDLCRAASRAGRHSPHAHLLGMSFGLIDDMCLRLSGSDPDEPDAAEAYPAFAL